MASLGSGKAASTGDLFARGDSREPTLSKPQSLLHRLSRNNHERTVGGVHSGVGLQSLIPDLPHGLHSGLKWYEWWVNEKKRCEPKETFDCLPDSALDSSQSTNESFTNLWQEIWRLLRTAPNISINDLISKLSASNLLLPSTDTSSTSSARNLVFTIIGWQTMLYQSDANTCPPSQLAIANEMDGHMGQAHMCLRQSQTCCKKPLHDLLLGFGVLLPPRNFEALHLTEDKQAFRDVRVTDTASFNAHLLTSIGGLVVKWIDSLACHLELDRASNTLFLFRYPSFCISQICIDKMESEEVIHKSALFACAAPYSSGQWATVDEVEQMLHETLLSYRLLFGQNKASRHLYRKLRPFDRLPEQARDEILTLLCARKHYQLDNMPILRERSTYDLYQDFPIYRARLAILVQHLNAKKPRSWRELWHDKRDSASWLTFWVVLIFGAVGIILSLLQVILQIVQLRQP